MKMFILCTQLFKNSILQAEKNNITESFLLNLKWSTPGIELTDLF